MTETPPGGDASDHPTSPDADEPEESSSNPLLELYEEMDGEDERGLTRAIEQGLAEAERNESPHQPAADEQASDGEDPKR